MEVILIQQGVAEVLKGEAKISRSLSQNEKNKMIDNARSVIILCLGDKALREVAREKIIVFISIQEQLGDFNKILDDLKNIEVKLEDEDKTFLILNSLSKSF
uniref:Retrovirus-related Pol polyprotein from transposon TNT 1-94 n=1 Tax=Cajanus cajan TaxID=3821 RepID=A0A151SPZ9_CAJCA|nr:hypothetical protein KK1_003104 [Cajanus cajan]